MLVTAIILSLLILLVLLRAGIIIEYNEAGFGLWLKAGFIKIKLMTDKARKKRKLKRIIRLGLGDMKPGSLSEFMDMLKTIKNALGRLRRRLLIKQLVIRYTSAGDDPAEAALGFGAAYAAIGIIIPLFERVFRIRRRDLLATADFDSKKPKIYAMLSMSIAIWEAFYVLAALLPMLTADDIKKQSTA